MAEQSGPGGSNWVTNRKKRRIPCQLWVGEREHSALILDLSPSGLFIQTHAKTQRGERIRLQFSHEDALLELKVEVVRTKHGAAEPAGRGQGRDRRADRERARGVLRAARGLGITERAKPTFELEREPGLRFRVHVAQIGGPRSRRVEVAAADADAAGARALEELGGGWKVLRVESV